MVRCFVREGAFEYQMCVQMAGAPPKVLAVQAGSLIGWAGQVGPCAENVQVRRKERRPWP